MIAQYAPHSFDRCLAPSFPWESSFTLRDTCRGVNAHKSEATVHSDAPDCPASKDRGRGSCRALIRLGEIGTKRRDDGGDKNVARVPQRIMYLHNYPTVKRTAHAKQWPERGGGGGTSKAFSSGRITKDIQCCSAFRWIGTTTRSCFHVPSSLKRGGYFFSNAFQSTTPLDMSCPLVISPLENA